MTPKILAAAFASLALFTAAPAAFAHAAMTKTNITDQASFAQAPKTFSATFEHETSLAGLMLMGPGAKHIELDYKPSTAMAKTFEVPLPALAAGAYILSWKTVAKDGHAMKGDIHFTVTGK